MASGRACVPGGEARVDLAAAEAQHVDGQVALGAHQIGQRAVERHAVEAVGEHDVAAGFDDGGEPEQIEHAEERRRRVGARALLVRSATSAMSVAKLSALSSAMRRAMPAGRRRR